MVYIEPPIGDRSEGYIYIYRDLYIIIYKIVKKRVFIWGALHNLLICGQSRLLDPATLHFDTQVLDLRFHATPVPPMADSKIRWDSPYSGIGVRGIYIYIGICIYLYIPNSPYSGIGVRGAIKKENVKTKKKTYSKSKNTYVMGLGKP